MTPAPSSSSQYHVVLGAGALGRATARALFARGCRTALVNRSGAAPGAPAGVTLHAGDLRRPETLAPIMAGAHAIHFCVQPPYHRWPEEFPPLQAAALALCAGSGARLVAGENLYGYGAVDGPMTEGLPLRAHTRKGRVRAAMHEDLMRAHRAGTVAVTVARGSDFFGPFVGGSAVGERGFKAVVGGKPAEVFGDPDTPHSFTFIEDFGAAMAMLGGDDRALGEVWHVPNAPPVSMRRFFELAFRLAETPPRMRKVGALELRMLGAVVPPVREMIEMQYAFEAPFVVDHGKFAAAFGDISTPLETALARTIEWTRQAAAA